MHEDAVVPLVADDCQCGNFQKEKRRVCPDAASGGRLRGVGLMAQVSSGQKGSSDSFGSSPQLTLNAVMTGGDF